MNANKYCLLKGTTGNGKNDGAWDGALWDYTVEIHSRKEGFPL